MAKRRDPRRTTSATPPEPSALPVRPTLTPLSAPRRAPAPRQLQSGLWETPEGFGVTVLK